MDSGYYAACTALKTQSNALELIANNVANLNTTGYRAQLPSFGSDTGRSLHREKSWSIQPQVKWISGALQIAFGQIEAGAFQHGELIMRLQPLLGVDFCPSTNNALTAGLARSGGVGLGAFIAKGLMKQAKHGAHRI